MIKTFITTISLQARGDLRTIFYNPQGFELKNNCETCFPIIPVIASETESEENIKIIAIRTVNHDTKDNYEVFLNEIENLGISKDKVTQISVEENQSKTIGMNMLMNILKEIPEDSLVFTDITFGTKPMSSILLYAMTYIEKLNKDVEVEGIYYGELPRENGKVAYERASLYDLTAYKYLSDVIEELNHLEVKNPLAALEKLLKM